MAIIQLADADTWADLSTFCARARALDADGAMRLQVSGTTLAVWVAVTSGQDLSGRGTTLGLRVLALAEPAQLDAIVPIGAVGDRLARASNGTELDVPPQEVRAAWASVSPPREGWTPAGSVAVTVLNDAAAQGIAEIAQGAPTGSGSAAVQDLRRRVWGRALPGERPETLPASVAFAAYTLGFLVGDTAQVFTAGRWHRVSTSAGHVLCR